jgi:hypothetical protein
MGRHSLAPSLDKDEVGEPNKGKCSYHEILVGMNQTIFEDGKNQATTGTSCLAGAITMQHGIQNALR